MATDEFPPDACQPGALIARIRALSSQLSPLPTDAEARLAPQPGIRAVLCDVYGTLLVSGSGDVGTATATDSATALAEALAAADLTGHLDQAGHRGAARLPELIAAAHEEQRAAGATAPEVEIRALWRTLLAELAAAGLLAGDPAAEAAIGERVAVEYECRVNPVWPMPGVVEMLTALRDRGLRLGIVSNAQFYTPLLFPTLLAATLPELGFEESLCAWSYRLGAAKPDTRLFAGPLAALAAAGIEPGEVLYLGNDCRNDIWTARQAGVRGVLFAGDRRSLRRREADPRCADLTPDAVVTALSQVPGLLVG
jgi:putative hydrolase of the HAD superfamily